MNNDCLISKEPIINKITLACNHSYEYIYLYEEIKQQKARHKNYFKCPYCRAMYLGNIPYYEIDDVEKISYINGNSKSLLPILHCSWNKCVSPGNSFKHGIFCWKHSKNVQHNKCTMICKTGLQCKNNCINDDIKLCNVHIKKENK